MQSDSTKIKVGLCGAVHPNMPGDDRGVYRRIVGSMEKLQKQMGFELVTLKKPVESEADGRAAREFFDGREVDLELIGTHTGALPLPPVVRYGRAPGKPGARLGC